MKSQIVDIAARRKIVVLVVIGAMELELALTVKSKENQIPRS